MAIYKTYDINLDTKRLTKQSPQGIRAGESGILFRFTLKNDDEVVDLSEADRIILEIQSNIGRNIIDSSDQDDGVIFVTEGNTTYARVPLNEESYAAGLNRCTLRVYTHFDGSAVEPAHDSEICAAEFQFRARA